MPEARQPTARSAIGSLALIAAVVAFGAAAFAYTAGWFSPDRLTPNKLVDAFKSPGGEPPLGHRRNHAKGICFTGMFEANGAGSELSRGAGVCARPVPGPRTLQSGHAQSERAGCDGAGARPRPQHLDPGRAGVAHGHDQCADLRRLDAAGVLRAPASPRAARTRMRCRLSSAPIPSSRSSATGPRTGPGPAATRKSGSTASTASSSPTIPAGSMRCDGR